ncbi:MAG: hypothetical protein IJW30_03365 [Clostridia bacterium]|nr:hypothetical protein [Clostridia bacterium]
MQDFHVYSPTEIIAANLREGAERFDALHVQELAHLRELATQILSTVPLSELLQALPDHRPPAASPTQDAQALAPALSARLCGLHATHRSVMLALMLSHLLRQDKALPTGMFFTDTETVLPEASHKIIYQKSSYTDEAYLTLSSLLTNPQAVYAHSFPASCEAVYNGACEYCILPIENAVEGQLNAFARLIDRYELKIAATCEIPESSAARSTRFALLRRRMLPIIELAHTEYRFACMLPQGSSPDVCDLLLAARLCGLHPDRLSSLPSNEGQLSAQLTFFTQDADLHAFLLYLAMEAPHYTPIGYYPHLKQKGI